MPVLLSDWSAIKNWVDFYALTWWEKVTFKVDVSLLLLYFFISYGRYFARLLSLARPDCKGYNIIGWEPVVSRCCPYSGQPNILRMHHSLGISRSHQVIRNWTNVSVHTLSYRVSTANIWQVYDENCEYLDMMYVWKKMLEKWTLEILWYTY